MTHKAEKGRDTKVTKRRASNGTRHTCEVRDTGKRKRHFKAERHDGIKGVGRDKGWGKWDHRETRYE